MQTTINLGALLAVSKAASKEETRYYLNGVLIEARERHVTYVASDGHILIAAREDLDGARDTPLIGDFIIPLNIITRFKLAQLKKFPFAVLSKKGDNMAIEFNGERIEFLPIDGTFPDWRRVIPSKISGDTAQFNPALLSRLSAAKKIFGETELITIAHNGSAPAVVSFGADTKNAFGIVMPFRAVAEPCVPKWVKEESK